MQGIYHWFDHVARIRLNGRSAELVHPARCQNVRGRRTASQHSDGLCRVAAVCMARNAKPYCTQYDTWEFDRWLQSQGIRPWHKWHAGTRQRPLPNAYRSEGMWQLVNKEEDHGRKEKG